MADIPKVSEAAIRERVDDQSFERGREYFRSGAIRDARREGVVLKARCEGSRPQPYRVQVTFDVTGIASADCSCPVGDGGYCKHVAALLLTWLHKPEMFVEGEELDAALERRSKAELIALVKQMLRQQPNLEWLLETPLPATGRKTTVDRETYRRQAAAVFHHGGCDDYNDYPDGGQIADELLAIKEIGDGFLEQQDHASAAAVFEGVVSAVTEHYESVQDENGDLGHVVAECVAGLGRCLAGESEQTTAREKILRALFDAYRFDLGIGGHDLAPDVPDLLAAHATPAERRTVAQWVREALPSGPAAGPAFTDNWLRGAYGGFLLALEADTLDDEAFLRICRETGRTSDAVDRLLALGRVDEAAQEAAPANDYALLALADLFVRHGHGDVAERLVREREPKTQDSRLLEWLKTRYVERGDAAAALEIAERLFRLRPSFEGYREARRLAEPLGLWDALHPDLLRFLRESPYQGSLLVRVYVDEGEIDLALAAVQPKKGAPADFSATYGYGYEPGDDVRLMVAQAAEETRPRAALEIYRQYAEWIVEHRNRACYGQACELLVRMRALHERLGERDAWQRYLTDLRALTRTLRAFKAEMAAAGL